AVRAPPEPSRRDAGARGAEGLADGPARRAPRPAGGPDHEPWRARRPTRLTGVHAGGSLAGNDSSDASSTSSSGGGSGGRAGYSRSILRASARGERRQSRTADVLRLRDGGALAGAAAPLAPRSGRARGLHTG